MKRKQWNLAINKFLRTLGIAILVIWAVTSACKRPESPKVSEEKTSNVIYYPDTTIIMKIDECAQVVFTDSTQQDHLYSICFRDVIETRTRRDSCWMRGIGEHGKVILQMTNETTKENFNLVRLVPGCFAPPAPTVNLHPLCVLYSNLLDTLDYAICVKYLFPYPDAVNKGNIPDSAYTLYLSIIKK